MYSTKPAPLQVVLHQFSVHQLFLHLTKSRPMDMVNTGVWNDLSTLASWQSRVGVPITQPTRSLLQNPFLFYSLSLGYIIPFSAPSPPNKVSIILSPNSVSPPPENCLSSPSSS